MYKVFRSEPYEEKLNKLDKSDQIRVIKFEQQLKNNPHTGKPLSFRFFREKKFNGKRLLYLIFDEFNIAFLVTITNKKEQQNQINLIKLKLGKYKQEIEEIAKNFKPL